MKRLLEFLAEHDCTTGVIVSQNGFVLRFAYNFQEHEWFVEELK